jgi:hypothetical protein
MRHLVLVLALLAMGLRTALATYKLVIGSFFDAGTI